LPHGGIEVHGGFVTNPDGNLDVTVPTKLSELENDSGFTNDYNGLKNKPTTITAQQADAIEANKKKRSYPKKDEDKLATIAEKATYGADWETNIENKPTTITEEQAQAIADNTEKLSKITDSATNGADWETNLQNIPYLLKEVLVAFDNAGIKNIRYFQETNTLRLNFNDGREKDYNNIL